ncbi:hypothetical protein, partial [Ilumatobacter sp.]|uniref:hypothetical protein n=1 Tax=Ilumatobacter sp. TaxID=1967498 RepID=UPI003C5FA842
QYGSKELHKKTLQAVSVKLNGDKTRVQVDFDKLPDSDDNSIYKFESNALPVTREGLMEAFYTISRR